MGLVPAACNSQACLVVAAVVLLLAGSFTAQYLDLRGTNERKLSRMLAVYAISLADIQVTCSPLALWQWGCSAGPTCRLQKLVLPLWY